MVQHPLIKTFMVLMAALFFTTQSYAHAHATEYGEDHHHEGVPCEIALVAAEQSVLTPPLPVPAPFILLRRVIILPPGVKLTPRRFDGRAPPPRAPPL